MWWKYGSWSELHLMGWRLAGTSAVVRWVCVCMCMCAKICNTEVNCSSVHWQERLQCEEHRFSFSCVQVWILLLQFYHLVGNLKSLGENLKSTILETVLMSNMESICSVWPLKITVQQSNELKWFHKPVL